MDGHPFDDETEPRASRDAGDDFASMGYEELSGWARAAIASRNPDMLGRVGREWAKRGLGLSPLDAACARDESGRGFFAFCESWGAARAVDALIEAGLARWEDCVGAKTVRSMRGPGAPPADMGDFERAAWAATAEAWEDGCDARGSSSRYRPEGSKAVSAAVRQFARFQPGMKARFAAGARRALAEAIAIPDEEAGPAPTPSDADFRARVQRAMGSVLSLCSLCGCAKELEADVASAGRREVERAKKRLGMAPWAAAEGAFKHDHVMAMSALVDGSRSAGLDVLGERLFPDAGPQGHSRLTSRFLEPLALRAARARAWACVVDLAERGADLGWDAGRAEESPAAEAIFEEFFEDAGAWAQNAGPAALKTRDLALAAVSASMAESALRADPKMSRQEAASAIERAAAFGALPKGSADLSGEEAAAREAMLLDQSFILAQWASGALASAQPRAPARRL